MKKVILALSLFTMTGTAVFAQDKKIAVATPPVSKPTSLTVDNLSFKADAFNFGNVDEGSPAVHVFEFKNTGKEPIVIDRVQPSCGCTTPDWTKEPIAPGKSGVIKASYGTQGRPGAFDKTLTVFSNAGTKVLTIKGMVDKAPEASVPQNSSMMRTN